MKEGFNCSEHADQAMLHTPKSVSPIGLPFFELYRPTLTFSGTILGLPYSSGPLQKLWAEVHPNSSLILPGSNRHIDDS